jgi:hypothetical protein
VQGNIAGAWGVFQPTITAAAIGYLWGNGIALLLATVVLVFPRTETVITQIAVVTYCLPIVAVGGISIVVLGGAKNPGDPSATAIFLAALVCVFTTVVGAILGFTSADKAALDVARLRRRRWTQLRKVRLVAALPAILTALQIAVPTAFLGAVLGEYLGAITAASDRRSSACRASWTRPASGRCSSCAPCSPSSPTDCSACSSDSSPRGVAGNGVSVTPSTQPTPAHPRHPTGTADPIAVARLRAERRRRLRRPCCARSATPASPFSCCCCSGRRS